MENYKKNKEYEIRIKQHFYTTKKKKQIFCKFELRLKFSKIMKTNQNNDNNKMEMTRNLICKKS